MIRLTFALFIFATLLASCTASNPHTQRKAHHTETGFKNIYYEDDKGFMAFMKWRWEKLFKDIPGVDDYQFKVVDVDHKALINNKDKSTLTWIGHATFLLQFENLNILTDPQFSERASPVSWAGPKRVVPAAIKIKDLPEIDAVVISHDHYDSLDVASIIELSKHNQDRTLTFIVPLGFKAWLDELELESVQVVELDWSESHTVDKVTFTAEPSQHWGKRTLFDAYERLWASFVISANDKKIFFAGDTGYAKHFKSIGEKYGHFDLSLLPIGAYEPRWFMKSYHINPEEAVKIHLDLHSKYSVAMHWGTFILTDEPLTEPPEKLTAALKKYQLNESVFKIYKHGETQVLDHLFTTGD